MTATRASVPLTLAVVAVAGVVAIVSHPLVSIPPDVALLYVSECPASQYAFKRLSASPIDAQAKMWPIPTESDVASPACAYALPKLRSRHWLFHLAPSGFLCRRLVDDADEFAKRKLKYFPSYVIDGEVLPDGLEAAALAHLGLSFSSSRSGRLVGLLAEVPKRVQRTPAEAMAEFYQPVGY